MLKLDHDPANYECHTDIKVIFRDIDAFGHVNNAVYFTYLENSRVEYIQGMGLAIDKASDYDFILAHVELDYLRPLVFPDTVAVHTRVSHLGGKSFEFEYLLVSGKNGEPVAFGKSVQVCFDFETQKPVAIPEKLRGLMEKARTSREMPAL